MQLPRAAAEWQRQQWAPACILGAVLLDVGSIPKIWGSLPDRAGGAMSPSRPAGVDVMSRRCRLVVVVAGVCALTRGVDEEATWPGSIVASKSGLSLAGYRTMAWWESGAAPRRR